MNGMNPKVEFFFHKAEKWQDEYEKLRMIVLLKALKAAGTFVTTGMHLS